MKAPVPARELERLAALHEYNILDTLPEEAYDDITFLAAQIADVPIAQMSLVDNDRQWFKSRVGVDLEETPRDIAFCAHTILNPDRVMIIPDATKDARFESNSLVRENPGIRFYAGAPLTTPDGLALGALCICDRKPRELSELQEQALLALSRQVMAQLELRRALKEVREAEEERNHYLRRLEEYQKKLEVRNENLSTASMTDGLTGLMNHSTFKSRLLDEFERARRQATSLSLAFMDVDHFKQFNDSHGHPAGDRVLRIVADTISEHARKRDIVARYGGEEFIMILTDTGEDEVYVVGERIRRAIEEKEWEHRPVTVSVGVVTLAPDITNCAMLLKMADQALYLAKSRGRNCTVSATCHMRNN